MALFVSADMLLPKENWEKWAVIACDQFVSQPDYWERVDAFVGKTLSTRHLILPEAYLQADCSEAISQINETMGAYLQEGVFTLLPDCFIYVERTLQNGTVRRGVVGAVDLEQYDYQKGSRSPVRATEETVEDRLPPRMDIRREAPLELPHILMLCDDDEKTLIESLTGKDMPLVYDFNLMEDGGRIRGWLVTGAVKEAFLRELDAYESRMEKKHGICYAIGDGNHSLAAAKGCYLEGKHRGLYGENHPARYALVELENIHDEAQAFEPIHRIVKDTAPEALVAAMEKAVGKPAGSPVLWQIGQKSGTVYVSDGEGKLPVGIIQDFLDGYLQTHKGEVDYVHGADAVQALALIPGTVGLTLPPVAKDGFFRGILAGGTLPRKTFSMGHAREKRYYLEARRIK